jgi:hypothetical protein
MPYYKIIVVTRGKGARCGIRESNIQDIEKAWQFFETRAKIVIPMTDIKSFSVVMLSRRSAEVQRYLQQKRRPPAADL